ncbi:hypothetical protein [Candidatus Avelusimicrobium fimicolum]|uniref:hypothetical protein n=1 Tax=Candidatus Avelusimicrobium fimicolum TaxID=3416216 RepID=UPI003CA61B8E|nr:hypothetical protein [Spirochaetia bacterium]
MTQLINWCTQHWQDVLAIIGGVVSVATIIVKLTPTQKDDAVLGKIIAVLSALSLVNTDGSFVGAKK